MKFFFSNVSTVLDYYLAEQKNTTWQRIAMLYWVVYSSRKQKSTQPAVSETVSKLPVGTSFANILLMSLFLVTLWKKLKIS
jgi:hypothetical protein